MLTKIVLLSAAVAMVVNIVSIGWSREEDNTPRGFGLTLTTDKAVYSPGEPISITLTVFNYTQDTITFTFASSQWYDFVVKKEGKKIWRWSEEKAFAQVMGEERINTGEKLAYKETYRPKKELALGTYSVAGRLACREPPVQATMYIKVAEKR